MDDLNSTPGTGDPDLDDQGWTVRRSLSLVFLVMTVEALSLGYTMTALGMPSIIHYFHTTQGGWLLTAFLLAGTVAAAMLGKLADLYGKRRILILTLVISGIGAVVCAIAPTLGIMIVGRALQGVVVACMPLSYSLIRDVFPRRLTPFAASVSATGVGVIAVVAPLLVGWLLLAFGFRGMFWFDALWTFAICPAILLTTPESALRRRSRVDVVGGLLLGGGVSALLLVVSMGQSWGWTSASTLLFGAAGVVLLISYFMQATRVREPLVNLRLFRRKPLILAIVVAAISSVGAVTNSVLPLLALTPRSLGGGYGLGMTTLQYAWIATPNGIASALAGMAVGLVMSRFSGTRMVIVVGMGMWVAGTIYLAFRNGTFADLEIGAIIVGAANGMTFAVVPNLVIAATPAGDQGSTSSAVMICQSGFGSTLPVILFAILATQAVRLPGNGILYRLAGFQYGLFLVAGIALVGILLTTTVLRIRRPRPGPAVAEPVAVGSADAG